MDTETLTRTARHFLEAYDKHAVDQMFSLCEAEGVFKYVPEGERGQGKISDGKAVWQMFVDAMPDFAVKIERIRAGDGFVVAETIQGGTPRIKIGEVEPTGRTTMSPHCYIMTFNESGKIDGITCYWDYNTIYTQLGHTELHE